MRTCCPHPAVAITVGPACQKVEQLVALLEAGVTCARIDLTVRGRRPYRPQPPAAPRSPDCMLLLAERGSMGAACPRMGHSVGVAWQQLQVPLAAERRRHWAPCLRGTLPRSRFPPLTNALCPCHPCSPLPQWAPIEYHRTSLLNLQEAMRRTKRLCAVMLDCLGRELMIKRK